MTRIDAHQHFWRPARGDYGWLTPQAHPAICRDYLPGDLAPLMAREGVGRTVLVQAAPSETETDFLLALAAKTPFVAGVVGWAMLEAADAPARIARFAGRSKAVGLRPMLQDLPADDWILDPRLGPAITAMTGAGLRFDALVTPRHLPHLLVFLARHPDLPVVVDHAAKPDIAAGALEPWAGQMRRIGRETRAFCKLSGLASEAAPGWTGAQLQPFMGVLLEAFGPRRLMWGSDWPVVEEAGGYRRWAAAALALISALPADDRDAILGGTAERFYGLAP